ncbi:MAG TPA: hypothetical protein VMJ52_15735 [Xanthobacteraceae bacterium]|nr:hypothetical protein [Xanthobacteraceae bacterium]
MDESSNNHHAGYRDREQNEPEGLPISDAEAIACDLGIGDSAIRELAQRVAGGIVSGARSAAINRECVRPVIGARETQHPVDDRPIIAPPRGECAVQIVLFSTMPDRLEAALGGGNLSIQRRHRLLRCRRLRRVGRQQIAALDGAEVRREVVEIAKRASCRQPNLGNVSREQIEIAQSPDAERAENAHEQEEDQEYRREVETDRLRLPHGADHCRFSACDADGLHYSRRKAPRR